jgi:hypothetical protein
MGYQFRMHNEVRAWLTGLCDTEPESARLAGEAVLALLEAGSALGPPLVVPLETVLRQLDDPREALDLTYQRQLEILTKVRRGVADVATSRKRVDLQLSALEQQAAKLASQLREAVGAGREDLAEAVREQEAGVRDQLSELRRQHLVLTGQEERLTVASQRLQAKVEAFRVRKETVKASYTAAEASQRVREAMGDLRAQTGEAEVPPEPGASPALAAATDAGGDRLRDLNLAPGDEPGDHGAVPLPPGIMVLLLGAPDDRRAGVLFVVEPEDTAVLVAQVAGAGRSREDYQAAARAGADRLPWDPAPDGTPSPGDAFTSYDAESFLDEFFPGAETEVEIGAGALVARSRAYTLAEARQRMSLTQAQVAERMNVRQERVSAIERAEPGATEVRTLAAYVGALGGRLEIIAHIGDEHIPLR